jgi:hypothetical protein
MVLCVQLILKYIHWALQLESCVSKYEAIFYTEQDFGGNTVNYSRGRINLSLFLALLDG